MSDDIWPVEIHFPWTPDQGDGTYRNPILFADYSDPDVIRDGNDFYLTASSFTCTPGLPILHSRDLVNWTLVNHALKNLPFPKYEKVHPGCGIWAPAIRWHAGQYHIFFSTPDDGIFQVTAKHPLNQWSEPHLVEPGKGLIDPCPFWDDDGRAYLVHAYAHSRSGIRDKLRVCPLASDGSRLLDPGQIVFEDPIHHPTVEGPKFLKRNGYYYILAPAGGVPQGWQLALRSRHIFGPYDVNVLLHQGKTPINGPHQGALVDAPDGTWWFLHFQDTLPYGRVVHLQPARWENDWPLLGTNHDAYGVGQPVARWTKPVVPAPSIAIPQTSDEFDQRQLSLQWQWQANHSDNWHSLQARPGWLRLFSQHVDKPDLRLTPNLLLQKFPAESFAVETEIDATAIAKGESAGLVVIGKEYAAISVNGDTPTRINVAINGQSIFLSESPERQLRLRVTITKGGHCTFSFANAGSTSLQQIDKEFTCPAGVWIGAKVGLFAISSNEFAAAGHADFKYFRFTPAANPVSTP